MADIKHLDYFLGSLPFNMLFGAEFKDCDMLKKLSLFSLEGSPTYVANVAQTGNVELINQSVTILEDLNSIATAVPEYVYDNTFTNNTSTEKTYTTLSFEKDVSTTLSTAVTHGFQIGGKIGAEVKGSVGVPFVADGSVTVSAEISGFYNFSKVSTDSTTTSHKLIIPSQSGNIPPNSQVRVQIMLAKINIPETAVHFSGSMSGMVIINGKEVYNIYDVVQQIESECPNAIINGETGLTLNNTNRTVDFSGSGMLSGKITAYNFYVKITESNQNGSSRENIRWYSKEPKVLSTTIIQHPSLPSNSEQCNC
ncbi:hypothetical protein ABE47_32420 [Bacillus thuringiensis]|uniref:ETX/MTX2 family pore-forming toxin n=1 Tax=Bacillus thuringiensis TaxID=1428 RepID=UPI0018CF229B|nr:ETX/MTX2 family pore-forming toxin [Bacillus thuringiensis]MBG9516637.1 hypothetical protein [Bacillus thuringiensis]